MNGTFSPRLTRLIDALRTLPGVGAKSAQRMAFSLLGERDRGGGYQLAEALRDAMDYVGRCRYCRMLTDEDVCAICRSQSRDHDRVCVVESPADVMAIETNTGFTGRYFVLSGRLSPIDGIGPEELGLDMLREQLVAAGARELILAIGATVEGQATAEYLADMARAHGVAVSRIAHGVPVGGELETVDASTLAQAFTGRSAL